MGAPKGPFFTLLIRTHLHPKPVDAFYFGCSNDRRGSSRADSFPAPNFPRLEAIR